MATYKHVLVAVDTSDEADQVVARARELASFNQATLTLLHVIEPLTYAYGGDLPMDFSGIQSELQHQAEQQIASLGERFGIPADKRVIVNGRPASEIRHHAEQCGADLIVLGSHGRHGIALLLGSTASGVLHGARCDVLAVRVSA